MRTDEEVVADCNELARLFYESMGYVVEKGYRFDKAHHLAEQGCWSQAVMAYEFIEGTDVESALDSIENG